MLTSSMIWSLIVLGYVWIILKWGEPFCYFLQQEMIGFIENRRLTRKNKKEPQADKHPQEGDGVISMKTGEGKTLNVVIEDDKLHKPDLSIPRKSRKED